MRDYLFEALLCDLDGVVVDSQAAITGLWDDVCDSEGSPVAVALRHGHTHGVAVEDSIRSLFPDADDTRRRDVLERVRSLERGMDIPVVAGATAALRSWTDSGRPLAFVTGASRERLARATEALGVTGRTAVTWGECEGKPSPEPYRLAASRVGKAPSRCLAIEDSVAGVTSAVAAGVVCAGLLAAVDPGRRGQEQAALERAGASWVVTAWDGLADVMNATRVGGLPGVSRRSG